MGDEIFALKEVKYGNMIFGSRARATPENEKRENLNK
jgi:hypothetical protein